MANERGQALAKVAMFSALSKRQLRRLQKAAGEYQYEAGQELVKEGAPGETLFAILEGSVKVVRGNRTLRRMGPGDYLGEVALFDQRPRTARGRTTKGTAPVKAARACTSSRLAAR